MEAIEQAIPYTYGGWKELCKAPQISYSS